MWCRRLLAGWLFAACSLAHASGAEVLIVLQRTLLAGFRHYDGRHAWPLLRTGDRVTLAREPQNMHDANAVRVIWRGRTLGYVPRHANGAVARQLDAGTPLEGRIVSLKRHRNGAARVEFDIVSPLQ